MPTAAESWPRRRPGASTPPIAAATTGSRIANGTFAVHRELEHDLAQAFGKRNAIAFTTGYQANLSMVTALCGTGDFVLLDADCHASLYDAARLSGATESWARFAIQR